MARFRAPPAGTQSADLYERIAELEKERTKWIMRCEEANNALFQKVEVIEGLEKFHKAVRNAYYAPPMEAAPITDHDHRQVSRGVCAALIALEGGKQK